MGANNRALGSEGERLSGSAKNEPLYSTPINQLSTKNKSTKKISVVGGANMGGAMIGGTTVGGAGRDTFSWRYV